MAKIFEGAIKLASTIQQTGAQPLDDRVVVAKVNDLYDSFGTAIYNGMLVAVAETGDVYMLKDKTKVGEAAGWKLIGGDTAADLTKVKEDVAKNKAAINVINGTGDGSITKAVSDAKTELIGDDAIADTIKHAEKLATDASAKVDTEIGKLDVTGNVSEAVKGVTVTVDETDGKVIKPVVSIADGTLTGAATDENLVTGSTVKTYVDGKVKTITDKADALSGRVDKLDATHTTKGDGSFNTVAEEVTTGIAGIAETSKANTAGSDVVVTVTTKSGSVSSVAVDSSVLKKAVTDEVTRAKAAEKKNADAIAAETTRATAAEKKNADAIAAETTRATAAEGQVKTDLLGNATTEYNTLGKLETKIKAAQATADAKVKSVKGTNTVVATTTEHAVSVSLKTSDKGNVKFTQDTDGLSANVTIPEATVTGVKADDKFLSLVDKLVSADVSIAYDNTDKKIYLYGKDKNKANAVSSIDCTDFIKDGMLEGSTLYNATAATGTVTINSKEYALTGLTAGHAYIVLVWNTDAAKDAMAIDVTSLIDIYTNGDGLTLDNHEFSVDWVKVAKKGDLDNEITRATAAEEKVKTDLIGVDGDAATKDTIYGAKQAVKDLKAQIEKDAVTLTIPDDDPYITASKDATTNKYTISSKKDGTTPLVDVKINTKLTDKINSLVGGGSADANGISITVTETAGKISAPAISVTPGEVAADNASVVTGGKVYTAVEAAKTAASSALAAALTWHEI